MTRHRIGLTGAGRQPGPPHQQRGMAILTVVLVLLSSLGLALAWASRGALTAQQFANNHYQAAQAHEAAVAGLEEGITWVAALAAQSYPASQPATCAAPNPFHGKCWTNEVLAAPFASTDLDQPPYNATGYQRLADRSVLVDYGTVSSGAGSYTTTVRIRHATDLSAINYLEVTARAVSNDSPEVTALAHQMVYFPFLPATRPVAAKAPVLINGCLTAAIAGSANICAQKNDGSAPCGSSDAAGSAIAVGNVNSCNGLVNGLLGAVSAVANTVGGLLGSNNYHGGTYATGVGGSSVFNALFPGVTTAQLQQVQAAQVAAGLTEITVPRRTVWYFDSTAGFDQQTHGTATSPAIVVINRTSLINLGSNITVNGALYVGAPNLPLLGLDLGIGTNLTVNGVLGVEGAPLTLLANNRIVYNDSFNTAMAVNARAPGTGTGSTARVPGSWRDF